MQSYQFFEVESIVINKVIFYTDRNPGGKYVFQSTELSQVINGYKNTNDYTSLEQILRELFSICDAGRRPWMPEAEQSFLELAWVGYDLLTYLRAASKISNKIYDSIKPLNITIRLENETAHLQKNYDLFDDKQRCNIDSILAIFYQLIHIYISVFDYWVSDFPQMATLPAIEDMTNLLEIGDDNDFAILLTAFAKTKDPKANLNRFSWR